jgi:CheY-like chemotaxis protein/HPt (histidine-containing phosphotransfer) domain-containing protein
VRDTGIGIPAEAQGRLFEAFTQADGSLTRRYGGTGLGLAISKQLVDLMHGRIGLESHPGSGSEFWFTIRLDLPDEQAPKPAAPSSLPNTRAVIVDDNSTAREFLEYQMRSWQMEVHSASSGHASLELLRRLAAENRPAQVVVLDLQMQDVDGLTLAQQIRADPLLAGIRLVMLTSLQLRLDAEAWRTAGINAYLVKPVKQSRLHDCLSTLLGETGSTVWVDRSGPRTRPDHAVPPEKVRILLVEDNLVNQKVALRQLKKLGYSADTVVTGTAAVETLRQSRYDVVLMDCQMPELDGYEATRLVRQFEKEGLLPGLRASYIIAMTANALEGDRDRCIAAGMNDYISKPVKLPELQAALQQAVWSAAPAAAPTPPFPPAAAAGESLLVLDTTVLAALRDLRDPDEPDPVPELIQLFLQDAPQRLAALDDAVARTEASGVREAAHSLKGSSNNIGARRLAHLCDELEQKARKADLTDAPGQIAMIREELAKVRFVLEAESKK